MSQDELNTRAKDAVLKYNINEAKAIAQQAVDEGADLVDLIQNGFTPGIKEVGDLFDAKKLFLPHIMAAANTMNAGIDILTPHLDSASTAASLGTFMICSIEGDIHSIGKDIVAVMMKVAGFDIINLGRDILVTDIVEAVKAQKPTVLGTSALMTSTMVNQKGLEEALKASGVREGLITNVGGAPVTQMWADEIGADIYSESASDCVAKMTAAMGDSA